MNALLWLVLLAGADDCKAGAAAYAAGRYREALVAFEAAEQAAGDSASPELLFNKALAALGADEPLAAEIAAERAAARGGPEYYARRDFVLGSAAFARAEFAEARALEQEAEPAAFDPAIAHAERARTFWQRAAVSRADWPAARRNVERAMLKLAVLRAARQEAERRRVADEEQRLRDGLPPPADAGEERGGAEEEVQPDPLVDELSSGEVERLLDRLARKEREKLALRRARRRAEARAVERDW